MLGNRVLLPFFHTGSTFSLNNHFFKRIFPDAVRFVKGPEFVNGETDAITKDFRSAAGAVVEFQVLKSVQCIVMDKVF